MRKYKTERNLEKHLIEELREDNWFVRKINCDDPGFPDIICSKYDSVLLIEVKLPKKNCKIQDMLENSQKSWITEYQKKSDNYVFLFWYWKETYFIIDPYILTTTTINDAFEKRNFTKYNTIQDIIDVLNSLI